jgi:hypothetical protein
MFILDIFLLHCNSNYVINNQTLFQYRGTVFYLTHILCFWPLPFDLLPQKLRAFTHCLPRCLCLEGLSKFTTVQSG